MKKKGASKSHKHMSWDESENHFLCLLDLKTQRAETHRENAEVTSDKYGLK